MGPMRVIHRGERPRTYLSGLWRRVGDWGGVGKYDLLRYPVSASLGT